MKIYGHKFLIMSHFYGLICHIAEQRQLIYWKSIKPNYFHILGSAEDAKDAVQEVLANFISSKNKEIENEIGYLIKGVINQSINIKKKKKKIIHDKIWLPEPVATENADDNLNREEIISYSMLVLLEKLNPKERAVFILKEAFDYSHKDIASILNLTIENARKLLSRAKNKLDSYKQAYALFPTAAAPSSYLENYIRVIKTGDTKALVKLLSEDISVAADGGDKVQVIRALTFGKLAASNLLVFVYKTFQKSQTIRLRMVNHQPALLFYQDDELVTCQVFDLEKNTLKIKHIYSVLDTDKLKMLTIS